MVRGALSERFLSVLEGLGGGAGNQRLRDQLGWQEDTYRAVRTYLVEQGNLRRRYVLKVVPKRMYEFFKKDFPHECAVHVFRGSLRARREMVRRAGVE